MRFSFFGGSTKCYWLLARSLGVVGLFAGACAEAGAEPLSYNRDVRPILSENCFTCHGPDSTARKADFRLDAPDATMLADVIAPGDPSGSMLMERILTEDHDDLMPPPESNLSLTAEEKATLKRWISEGAPYEKHWAFIPPEAPALPVVENAPTPIDALVRAPLTAVGLAPAQEASKEALIRRVAFDITGLPPTLSEIDNFVADTSPDAYATMVDQYLSRPAYGEHLAGLWLDVARYADSYGYQNDKDSPVWPWRDWVIRAFTNNMPYDQFILEQIAGDLLPNPTQDQHLATTFNRLHRQTNEGGSINEEFRVAYVSDRTETFGTAFLGMTLNCSRCHDHKFDPISQENYFQLSAFFNNIDESGMYSHFTDAIPSPSMLLYRDGEQARHEQLRAVIMGEEKSLTSAFDATQERLAAWMEDVNRAIPLPEPIVVLSLDSLEDGKTPDTAAERFATLTRNPEAVPGPEGMALRFDGENGVVLKDSVVARDRYQPMSFSVWIRTPERAPRSVIFHRSEAAMDAASRGYELLLLDGKPTFSLSHFWPGNAIRVQAKAPLPLNTWTHCAITYDGSSQAEGVTLYVNGQAVATDTIRDGLTKTILYGGEKDTPPLQLAMRFRDNGFKGGELDTFQLFDRCLTPLEILAISGRANLVASIEQKISEQPSDPSLHTYFAHAVDSEYQKKLAKREAALKNEADFVASIQSIMVMREMEEMRTAYLLERGEYNHRAAVVEPNTPEGILPMAKELPRNRLGLAKWLIDPQNPLTARIVVNRLWQQCFGRGLVETQEDFGNQGALPSNQALLDYLAVRFVDSGWDVKALLREILLSATYRQSSWANPELLERDPDNALLARGPKHRLSAEQIRDNALASAGLLVEKTGGPSVKPYQPPGLWKEASGQEYTPDTGEGLYRRSLYTFVKRTVPPPSMLTFNATSREVCLVRRESTVTPLQALVLLNDPQYVEAARYLAGTTPPASEEDDTWISTIFRRLTGRLPDEGERRILREALAAQYAYFEMTPDAAAAYLAVGEQPLPEGIDTVWLAAATALTQVIMNHEEFQVKQ